MSILLLENNLEIQQKLIEIWEREYSEQGTGIPMYYNWTDGIIPIHSLKKHKPKSIKKAQIYAEQIKSGIIFPPIIVTKYNDKFYELLDGYHRCWAYEKENILLVKAYIGFH